MAVWSLKLFLVQVDIKMNWPGLQSGYTKQLVRQFLNNAKTIYSQNGFSGIQNNLDWDSKFAGVKVWSSFKLSNGRMQTFIGKYLKKFNSKPFPTILY